MPTKSLIIDELGEQALLLPQKLAGALAANDRVKLCLTMLQSAERHAAHPGEPVADLSSEQRSAGVPEELSRAICDSELTNDGSVRIPGAQQLRALILEDVEAMLAPLRLAAAPQAAELTTRQRALYAQLPAFTEDRVPFGVIGAMTSARDCASGSAGSLHRLVMDLHRALNELQAQIAEETLDGARVWRVEPADRPLISAFMRGVNETAPLKFDHPGLGTTATRNGEQLVIENDIGTSDAHLLVVHVRGLAVSITYTDVHARRLAFFQSLFTALPLTWTQSDAHRSAGTDADSVEDYILAVGHLQATDAGGLERFLTFLGSRIVFLIDWNRARRQLQSFVPKEAAEHLLRWAADGNLGHRAFLQLGGERLVYEAMQFAKPTPLRYGEPLSESLGEQVAVEYLQFVLREAATGLLAGRAERFIRDEVKVELARRFRSANAGLLRLGLAHAERVFDIAASVREGMLWHGEPGAQRLLDGVARRAREWERCCDALVAEVRTQARSTSHPETFARLLHEADEAADGLEETAFLMTHLPTVNATGRLGEPLHRLAGLLVEGAQESVKMFEAAAHVTRESAREDVQDFFAAVERIVSIEHATDEAERGVTTALMSQPIDARELHLLASLARALEGSADALARVALMLRDHLLNDVMAELRA